MSLCRLFLYLQNTFSIFSSFLCDLLLCLITVLFSNLLFCSDRTQVSPEEMRLWSSHLGRLYITYYMPQPFAHTHTPMFIYLSFLFLALLQKRQKLLQKLFFTQVDVTLTNAVYLKDKSLSYRSNLIVGFCHTNYSISWSSRTTWLERN